MIIKELSDTLAIKWLDNDDVDRCLELRKNNKSDVGGTRFSSIEFNRHLLANQYLSIKPSWAYRGYGVIDRRTGELYSYILFKMMYSHRAWLLRLAISNQNYNCGLPLNGLGHVLDSVIDYAESKEYFQYYTLTPTERVSAHDRVWTSISTKKKDRYLSLLEEVIPPGVVPGYSFYWEDIMGRATMTYEAAIRRVVLLPEHRTFRNATIAD